MICFSVFFKIRWISEIGLPILILYDFKIDDNINGMRGVQIIHQICADNTEKRVVKDPLAVGNLQSYWTTTKLWKLTVVLDYCEAM
jgi:hypothetical protein